MNGILLGLEERDNRLQLKNELFPCCSGEGFRSVNDLGLRRCALKARLDSVQKIWLQFQHYWPKASRDFMFSSSTNSAEILRNVSDVIKGQSPQATSLSGEKSIPGNLWLMALVAGGLESKLT